MTKRQFLGAAAAAPFFLESRAAAQDATAAIDVGAIAAQVAGRIVIGLDGTLEVFQYFLFVDGLGSDLYSGTPSERTAHFTLRTDRLRPILAQNGDVTHVGFQPAASEGLYRIYFDPSPQRDFTRPETFASGVQVGTFRSRRTQATMVSGSHVLVTGTADVADAVDFTFRGKTLNIGSLIKAGTFTFHVKAFSLADLGVTTLSLPYGGHIAKVG